MCKIDKKLYGKFKMPGINRTAFLTTSVPVFTNVRQHKCLVREHPLVVF